MAATLFLTSETEIDETKKVVKTNMILYWYKGDFGGTKGIRTILSNYLGKDISGYAIQFKKYDWSTHLKNFTLEN